MTTTHVKEEEVVGGRLLAKLWEVETVSTPGELRKIEGCNKKFTKTFQGEPCWNKPWFLCHLAGVELEESLLPKMVLYCGGPPGGAANTHFSQTSCENEQTGELRRSSEN